MWVSISIIAGTLMVWTGIIFFSWYGLSDTASDLIPLGIVLMWLGLISLTVGFVYQLVTK